MLILTIRRMTLPISVIICLLLSNTLLDYVLQIVFKIFTLMLHILKDMSE